MNYKTIAIFCLSLLLSVMAAAMKFHEKMHVKIIEANSNDMESFDLHKNVNYWCNDGTNDTCICSSYKIGRNQKWLEAHKNNMNIIDSTLKLDHSMDITFLGDSITEDWSGRWFNGGPNFEEVGKVFKKYFRKESGGSLNGLPLGIAGDKCPELLWRIQNGEMPEDLNPKIWWILIGINDLYTWGCSEEAIVIGILHVVEEVYYKKPNSTIVINGILPSSRSKGKLDDVWGMILNINTELKAICQKYNRLFYFDATNIFLQVDSIEGEDDTIGEDVIAKHLMPDFLHPSAEGHELWAVEIVKYIEENQLLK